MRQNTCFEVSSGEVTLNPGTKGEIGALPAQWGDLGNGEAHAMICWPVLVTIAFVFFFKKSKNSSVVPETTVIIHLGP